MALPVFSCCILGFIPPIVIAAKARTRQAALWAAGFTIAYLIGVTLIGLQPEDADNIGTRFGAVLIIATGIGGADYSAIVGSKLDWSAGTSAATTVTAWPPPDLNEGAIAGVLAARQKRRRRELWRSATHRWLATSASAVQTYHGTTTTAGWST